MSQRCKRVNVEVDVMAKYAEKSLAGYLGGQVGDAPMPVLEQMVERIVAEKLRERGV